MNDPKSIINAYLDGELTAAHHQELVAWIRQSSDNRKHFVTECYFHSQLQDIFAGERAIRDATELQTCDIQHAPSPPSIASALTLDPSVLNSPIPSLGGHITQGALGYFSSGWPVAYLVAIAIVGIGLAVGALVHVSQPVQLVDRSQEVGVGRRPIEPGVQFVGRITGMVDCRWADPNTAVPGPVAVPLGRKYALSSGLLEITYDTGARVILQGPVTYEVESRDGGYLSVGKLTARVEKNNNLPSPDQPSVGARRGAGGEGGEKNGNRNESQSALTLTLSQGERGPGARSSFLIPTSYFAVRTPTAIVTDLGTEFGVEVNKETGEARIHVLTGVVEAKPASGAFANRTWQLRENEAITIDAEHEPTPTACDRKGFREPESILRALRSDNAPTPGTVTITDLGPTPEGLAGRLQADDDLQRAFVAGTATLKLVSGRPVQNTEQRNPSRLCDAQNADVFSTTSDGSQFPDNHFDHMFIAPRDDQRQPAVYDIAFGPEYQGSRDLHEINIFHGPNTTRSPYSFDVLYSTTTLPGVFRPLARAHDYTTMNGTLIRIECKPGEVTDLTAIRLVIRPIQMETGRWIGNAFAEIDANFHPPAAQEKGGSAN